MKKLNLKELESKLPKIGENFSKILIGGDSYGDIDDDFNNNQRSGPTGPLYDPTDYETSPLLDYDIDISIDGFIENDDQDDGHTGSHSGYSTSSIIPFVKPSNWTDGMNLNNNSLYIGSIHDRIRQQLELILSSNATIRQNLAEVDAGHVALVMQLADLTDAGAQTTPSTYPTFYIQFNSDFVTPNNGWHWVPNSTTDGFDLSLIASLGGITEPMRDVLYLAHVTMHESFHVNHWNDFLSMLVHHGADVNNPTGTATNDTYLQTVQSLLSQGYNPAFVNIFGHIESGGGNQTFNAHWDDPSPDPDFPNLASFLGHQYMQNNEQGEFEDCVLEMLSDLMEIQQTEENMRGWLEHLQNCAQQYGDESNPDGESPPGPNWPELYEQQQHAYDDFMQEYGWLFP